MTVDREIAIGERLDIVPTSDLALYRLMRAVLFDLRTYGGYRRDGKDIAALTRGCVYLKKKVRKTHK